MYTLAYLIHTDLFHVQVRLVVDGHSSVTVIFRAESCPGGVVFAKRIMVLRTSLKQLIKKN